MLGSATGWDAAGSAPLILPSGQLCRSHHQCQSPPMGGCTGNDLPSRDARRGVRAGTSHLLRPLCASSLNCAHLPHTSLPTLAPGRREGHTPSAPGQRRRPGSLPSCTPRHTVHRICSSSWGMPVSEQRRFRSVEPARSQPLPCNHIKVARLLFTLGAVAPVSPPRPGLLPTRCRLPPPPLSALLPPPLAPAAAAQPADRPGARPALAGRHVHGHPAGGGGHAAGAAVEGGAAAG